MKFRLRLSSRVGIKRNTAQSERLLKLLDGLPLAIAQAGAYLQESGVGLEKYLAFYEQQWRELMKSRDWVNAPLQDYPDRSVWTTWAISYKAIQDKHPATANLLLLWSFLDNRDLWYGLFSAAYQYSKVAEKMLTDWIGDIARNELEFSMAMQVLRNYSLIEHTEELASYATHPVVHRWAYHYQGKCFQSNLARLAVGTVGWAVVDSSAKDYSAMQRRLLPHAQASSRWVSTQIGRSSRSQRDCGMDRSRSEEKAVILVAIRRLGRLYMDQGKLNEAEKMYEQALRGYQRALGPKHRSTLHAVNNLGLLFANQGKLDVAKKMYEQALQGYEEALGPKHTSTLHTVSNITRPPLREPRKARGGREDVRAGTARV
ncbi:uncharacterized protein BDR25DRAFT_71181 [Lindgomyces ingoldianus]|uniref:Uncharacterized protein n=1 Tax=Lindgomyces ingoldianus TaxID=673940 RepID=A0ACB6QK11_9PLEO|nr:uncharacterized protein BDR25DRAFT_71181 [Lindgomyces ingoldianus]KAF2466855.1 hypothetical protein BDR25DRAFT_71181 [Lindgomyces ingoldianus]